MKRLLTISILPLILSFAAQNNNEEIKKVKYGRVTIEELKMTNYLPDTTADAVILYSLGKFDPNRLKFTRHIRIKILRQSGKRQASMAFYGKLSSTVKGCTYNLENGKIVKTRLQKESIFEVRVFGNNYNTKIALPSVRVGSVIEVVVILDGVPSFYDFQENIPVVYSALFFPPNSHIDIKCKETGIDNFVYKNATTWIAKDLPAFKYQSHMKRESDYRVRIEFELTAIQHKPYDGTENAKPILFNETNRMYEIFPPNLYQ